MAASTRRVDIDGTQPQLQAQGSARREDPCAHQSRQSMLRNYLLIALRNLRKNTISSSVNVIGLSVAIACAIVIFLFLERAYTMDRFHEDSDRIFLVENIVERNGGSRLFGDSPSPLGPAMKRDLPQVEEMARVAYGRATFRVDDRVFAEGLWFVDESFLDLFSYPMVRGDADAFQDPNSIVLSAPIAQKYFGEDDPVGRDIAVTFDDDIVEVFTVRAVADRFPTKASFTFDALIPFEKQRLLGIDPDDWARYIGATFIRTREPSDLPDVAGQMAPYLALQNAANDDWPITRFAFDGLRELSLHSENMSSDISGGAHPTAIVVLALVALFMLALSCFNAMNLAVATAARRLKEIGVRKAMGGSRSQLIVQFLGENLLLCFLSLAVGALLALFIFIPGFNYLFDFVGGTISFGEAGQTALWIFLVALMLVTAIASGIYPAFYVASFQPSAILHGQLTLGRRRVFTRAFLTLQFVLAFLTMIMGVILAQNANYQSNKDWGYEREHRLVVPVRDGAQYTVLRDAVAAVPEVETVVGSRGQFGRSWSRPVLDIEGEKMDVNQFDVGPGYLQEYGLTLLAGRLFDTRPVTQIGSEVLINESFAEARGWTPADAVDRSFRQDSLAYSVAGVVADVVYQSFYDPIEPTIFRLVPDDDFRFMSLTIVPGADVRAADAVRDIWKQLYPDLPWSGFHQDTVFDRVNHQNENIKRLFLIIAMLALLIACLGLFALTVQNIVRRRREISIRKVLGASVSHISRVVNRSFVGLIVVAALVATPLGYLGMRALLDSVYPDPIGIGVWPFMLSYALVLVAAVVTIATQTGRIVSNNPAAVLGSE